jgi:hypothetical protein
MENRDNTKNMENRGRIKMSRAPLASCICSLSLIFLFSFETVAAVLLLPVEARADVLFPDDSYVAGWVKSGRVLRFEKSNLFDYIDGGAELFLEFGFVKLLVQRYKSANGKGDEEVAVEVYEMESPEAALGIYLMKSGNETPIKGIKARNSGDRYQFSVVKGNSFVQINNFGGNEKLIPVMVNLTQQTLASISKGRSVTLLNRLPKKGLVAGSGLIIRGPYALQPIFTFGKGDVLQLEGKVFGVVGDYVGRKGEVYTRILIFYPRPKAAQSALDYLANHLDTYLEVVSKWHRGFAFKDYRNKFGTVELKDDVMEIKVNLSQEPVQSGDKKSGAKR